jgi:hypothetical protein
MKPLLAAGALVLLVALTACSDDDGPPPTAPGGERAAVAASRPSELVTFPISREVMAPELAPKLNVDRLLNAVRARDVDALLRLVAYVPRPCTPPGERAAIVCPAGAKPGTPVPVVGVQGCTRSWYRRDEEKHLRRDLEAFFEVPRYLWAVAKGPPFPEEADGPPGDYLAVFSPPVAVAVTADGVTFIRFPCSARDWFDEMLIVPREFLIAP